MDKGDMVLSQVALGDELGLYVNQAALGGRCVRGSCCNWASCELSPEDAPFPVGPVLFTPHGLKKKSYTYM